MPHLTLNVKTTNGAFKDSVNVENHGQKIVDDAIHQKHLDPHPPLPYVLKRAADGVSLQVGDKIETYHLHDGDTVIVQAPESTDGTDASGARR
jgi:hypothetical protein